ncbi:hypothetical protein [Pedobacter jeongneungensis]|uniref:hypothetical protein n=1 Tax=Pedobacter jeongneungensis TaxID=947309 RepID=UPI0004687B97|nr:hypothetical protein [Pedobacter jeongneungensis]
MFNKLSAKLSAMLPLNVLLSKGKKEKKEYDSYPNRYNSSFYNNEDSLVKSSPKYISLCIQHDKR